MPILVVDDAPGVRQVLERALRLEGFEVDVAHDGPGAVEGAAQRKP